MFNLRDMLMSLVGGEGAGQATKGIDKKGKKSISGYNFGGGGAMHRQPGEIGGRRFDPSLLEYRQPMQYAHKQPMAGSMDNLDPYQKDFPGRTNYGVPEDNMIDTRMGYMKPEQYDQVMNSARGERGYMNPVQGGGSLYRPQQPTMQSQQFNPLGLYRPSYNPEQYDNRFNLQVR